MLTPVSCWSDCQQEFVVESPSRGSDELTEGVSVTCPHCGHKYIFTVDGDGEADLQDTDPDTLGAFIEDPDSTHF